MGFWPVKLKLQKSITSKDIDMFKKDHRLAKKWIEYVMLTVYESHIVLGSMPGRGRFQKKLIRQLTKEARRRVIIISTISKNHFDIYSTNWLNFKKFLHKFHKKFGKVLVFTGNIELSPDFFFKRPFFVEYKVSTSCCKYR